MKYLFTALSVVLLVGCSRSTQRHTREVERLVKRLGGSEIIVSESKILFNQLPPNEQKSFLKTDKSLNDFPAISSLGDVFHYSPTPIKQISIRRYNSHRDTYWIYLFNSEPDSGTLNYKNISGNIYLIEPVE